MSTSILESIIDGVKAIAPTVANVVLPGSGPLLNTLIRSVAGDPPETPIEQSAAKVAADPKLYLELQSRIMDHEAKLAEIDSKRIESVNRSMREESKSEHWPQYSWRPYNGFLYGTTIFCVYVVLPVFKVPVPDVPQWVWIGWGAILGVTSWHRGREKRAKVGDKDPGLIVGTIKALRGDGGN